MNILRHLNTSLTGLIEVIRGCIDTFLFCFVLAINILKFYRGPCEPPLKMSSVSTSLPTGI